jgi:hypothetical protein
MDWPVVWANLDPCAKERRSNRQRIQIHSSKVEEAGW